MNTHCRLLALFAFMFLTLVSFGQRLQDWIVLGDKALEDNDPMGALHYYGEAMNIDSAKGEVNYKYAEALRLNHDYKKAAYHYYKVYRRERGKIFPESGAWLATMQKQSGNYEEAKQTWRRVRDQYSSEKDGYWYRKAVQEMRSCDVAAEWQNEEPPFNLSPLPETVNSDASEFAGLYLPTGVVLFASLRGDSDEKGRITGIYEPRLFITDEKIETTSTYEFSSVPGAAYGYAESFDGTMKAIARKAESGQKEILLFKNDSQQPFLQIPPKADSAWYSHPAFGKFDGRDVLFFSSDRSGGEGREDIWYIFLDQDQSEPINAGAQINTAGSEVSPFVREIEQKLYFSSDWHYGFGGFDIFSIDILDNNFGYPENLQKPFNTPAHDLYYSFQDKISKGLVTSNRAGAETDHTAGCCNDLWSFSEKQLVDTLPQITNLEELNDYLPVKLYFHNDEPDPKTRREETKLSYERTYRAYVSLLPEYELEYSKGLSEDVGDKAENAMDRFFIDEVDKGMENLELFAKLLLRELEKGQNVQITVKGFASPLAKTDYNVKLTSRRISSLVNYLSEYQRGAFHPYMNGTAVSGAKLTFNRIPFGEYVASNVVSDNPNEANAIYGIAAARERKIEIVSVQRAAADTAVGKISFTTEIIDLGLVSSNDSVRFEFPYIGTQLLQIDSLMYDSLAIFAEVQSNKKIRGSLKPEDNKGKHNKVITVYGNFSDGKKELNITYEIEK